MDKNVEIILTKDLVLELGLEKIAVITADMLNGYTCIEDGAFSCLSLTSIEIPNSVTSIGDWAFCECTSLTSITIPNSVTSIGSSAFSGCSGLTSIEIPNSVTSIGAWAFCDCSSLTSVTIPNSVTSIEAGAFSGCSSLTSITIPNSVTSIGSSAFDGCSSLTSIEIPNSVTSIGDWAFCECTSLTSITIPNSVTSIGSSAFDGCSSLTSVTIGDKTYKKQTVTNGKCKAYKVFNVDMTCRDFQYEEGKTYELDGEPMLCHYGFHACLNLADVFNYYYGNLGEDIVVHEVELEEVSDKHHVDDSKIVAKKITIGKRIL